MGQSEGRTQGVCEGEGEGVAAGGGDGAAAGVGDGEGVVVGVCDGEGVVAGVCDGEGVAVGVCACALSAKATSRYSADAVIKSNLYLRNLSDIAIKWCSAWPPIAPPGAVDVPNPSGSTESQQIYCWTYDDC